MEYISNSRRCAQDHSTATARASLASVFDPKVAMWFVLLAAFLSSGCWILGPYSYVPMHDNGDSQVPVFHTLLNLISQHGLLRWYPLHLGGVDEAVTYNIFQFETPFFLYLPIWAAVASILFLQHLIGGLGMYAYCRTKFASSPVAAIVAGIAYTSPICIMFGSLHPEEWWWNNYFEYRIAWGFAQPALPFFLLAIDYASKFNNGVLNISIGAAIGIALGLSMFIVGFWPYTVLFIGMCVLLLGSGAWINRFLVLATAALMSALPQLPSLLGSGYLYEGSHRAVTDAIPTAISWTATINDTANVFMHLGLSRFYGLYFRIFPVSFIIIGLCICISLFRRQLDLRQTARIVLLFVCFAITVDLAQNFKQIFFLLSLPSLFLRIDTNYLWGIGTKFLVAFGLGYGIHLLLRLPAGRFAVAYRRAVITAAAVIPISYATLTYEIQGIAEWTQSGSAYANYGSPQMRELARLSANGIPFRVATISDYFLVPIEPNYFNPMGFEGIDGHENLFSLRYGRYLLAVLAPERATYLDQFVHGHVGTTYDDKPVISNRAYIIYKPGPLHDSVNLDLLAFGNVRYILSPIKQDDSRLRLVLEPHPESWNWETAPAVARFAHGAVGIMQKINIGRLAPKANAFYHYHLNRIVDSLPTNFGGRELYIYENTLWAPRAFLVSETEVHAPNDVWDVLSRRSLSELMAKAIVEAPIMPPLGGEATGVQSVPPRFTRYEPEHLEIEGVASRASLVVITNSYSPYWKPRVNGNAETALPAYGAFTAVRVPAGHFAIDLRYQPPTLLSRLGLAGENR